MRKLSPQQRHDQDKSPAGSAIFTAPGLQKGHPDLVPSVHQAESANWARMKIFLGVGTQESLVTQPEVRRGSQDLCRACECGGLRKSCITSPLQHSPLRASLLLGPAA